MVKYTPLERSSLSSLIRWPQLFYSSSKFIWAAVPLLHNAHFPALSLHELKEGRVHANTRLVTFQIGKLQRDFLRWFALKKQIDVYIYLGKIEHITRRRLPANAEVVALVAGNTAEFAVCQREVTRDTANCVSLCIIQFQLRPVPPPSGLTPGH